MSVTLQAIVIVVIVSNALCSQFPAGTSAHSVDPHLQISNTVLVLSVETPPVPTPLHAREVAY